MRGEPSLSDRLARAIVGVISDRGLQTGDALPSVRDLAAQFDVTPPTIREAMRQLEATNTIEMRHGSGTYVGEGIHRALMPNRNSSPLSSDKLLSLIKARITIEPGIAALAAENRTDGNLCELRESASNAAKRGQSPVRNFHREIARACGNPILFEVIDSLLYVHGSEQRKLRELIEDREREHQRHEEIYAAIAEGEPQRASTLMRVHLDELHEEAVTVLARNHAKVVAP